ncbi:MULTISPECIES: tRNA1(Val) (adenine(37)-N6)-methyltransferase [Elizabethkingia]|uniref:tRNA1(Val) (adenine(37)-N6)-methyltransferase n=1 Tax=Elizabethkingia TaxID=308865 RepID=UPI00077EA3DE|nr:MULTISPECIES: methyltransferase [Elizabethkingia]AMR42531.1 tRNA (adenine-N(6)-)-methyltransferase [Elizabethkingia anophelis]AMX49171.1 tRNA (adenine-N(6)-)-methyltransferase [Elizabethkingia anophelis]AMX52629.1 tRNA (adenine-N(6)-)-methyltransferase [Elizabethkingia anophelis]AMX56020.1 tRNA (adenine-N(6)-)-methyltransferase [Elizabethkingia anophelis]EGT4346813.1 methyltransferase domain-containing protein [Elizabethkingia anophelis]
MKPFVFKQFEILQDKEVFRVGTDGVVLGALCNGEGVARALEVGCGTGLISLMLAQRFSSAVFDALDINTKAVEIAGQNFSNSPFANRLNVVEINYNDFESVEKYDLIVSNPPYFESDSSKDLIARHQVLLSFQQLIYKSARLISDTGILSVIIPCDDAENFITIAEDNNLHLIRKIDIYGIKGGKLKRNILEFSRKLSELVLEELVLEKEKRIYSDEYRELTKDFHPMF